MIKKIGKKVIFIIMSSAVGFANGFFGGGGGMLLVPLLEKGLKCPVKKSHATAIAIILPISIAGAITYAINGYFSTVSVFSVAGGCVVGGLIGALLLKKLSADVVKIIFAVIMTGVGIKLGFFG